ncbi:hypothetical protein Sste5346_003712 [Sporothrix stenoceras]|uniref:Uncharacterized protein n=1 Tax=Sporothrix stenoceras TaxID=5173 RepID=A0ABR3ZC14_9PEZI
MTVSRGWSFNVLKEHVLREPVANFSPCRDIDLFLDRGSQRSGMGVPDAVHLLHHRFGLDSTLHGDSTRHKADYEILEKLHRDYVNWLRKAQCMQDAGGAPGSRFTSTNANGMWQYSPFLCGTGPEEALAESYRCSFTVMERILEPGLLVHLHNMLTKEGYLTRPIELYEKLEQLFAKLFSVPLVPGIR